MTLPKKTPTPALRWLDNEIDTAQAVVDKHIAKLQKDPYEALHWVTSAIEAAATIKVCLHTPTHERVVAVHARATLLSMADRGMVRSTAQLDPQLHAEEMRAWAKVATMFGTNEGESP